MHLVAVAVSGLLRRFHERVTILNAPLADPGYGGRQERDWSAAVRQVAVPALVEPLTTEEDLDQRQTTTTRWRLRLAPSADLRATSRVLWLDLQLEVDGEVGAWRRHGRTTYLDAVVRRISEDA